MRTCLLSIALTILSRPRSWQIHDGRLQAELSTAVLVADDCQGLSSCCSSAAMPDQHRGMRSSRAEKTLSRRSRRH
jgi:hypothetical protein